MDSSHPIGVFDSGVGGLSVVREILKQLPDESIVYFGDTARVPYGGRPPEEIVAFGDQILSFLLQFDVKVVVAACNTSTSVSLPVLRRKYHLPLLGVVEPGVRAALQVTGNRRIGVLATAATVNSGSYTRGFQAYDPGVTVFAQACPQFVPLVESGQIDGPGGPGRSPAVFAATSGCRGGYHSAGLHPLSLSGAGDQGTGRRGGKGGGPG